MKNKGLYLILIVLLLASLACSLLGGGDSASEGSPPLDGGDGAPPPPPAGSGEYDTEFPMPPDVDNFMDMGDGSINYWTSLTIDEAVDFYLESCKKANREPNKPFSGKFVIRVDSSLHREIALAAVGAGKSLNKWVADKLEQAIHAH